MHKKLVTLLGLLALSAGPGGLTPAALSTPLPEATLEPLQQAEPLASADDRGAGPEVYVQTPSIDWGTDTGNVTPYTWSAQVDNPNDRPVLVKVELNFVTEQGDLLHQDSVSGHVGPNSAVILQQNGSLSSVDLDRIAEARGVPSAWWADEPYKIRTLAAFVDGLQRLEVFFVLENWMGRPVTSGGTVDLYIVERERLRAEFDGGGMRRRMTTLYARRFNVSTSDFSRRRIGFVETDYAPPALTLGPIHYSIFDHEPRGDEGVVRVVFRTPSGVEIVAEDRVFF